MAGTDWSVVPKNEACGASGVLSRLTERLLERNERLPLRFKLVPAQTLADLRHLEVQLTDLHEVKGWHRKCSRARLVAAAGATTARCAQRQVEGRQLGSGRRTH